MKQNSQIVLQGRAAMMNCCNFLISFLFFLSPCFSQVAFHKSVDSLFSDYNEKTPGYAVAIVKDGKVDYLQGYGMANLEYAVPITPSTVFHLASVSKQFTAFCIYLLAKEGKLNLDDSVQKYLPELPHYKNPVTILHLLHHTSGIRDQWELLGLTGTAEPDLITQKNVLDIIYRQHELNFKTNDKWLYSNSGYSLLAEIVSKVAGMPFSEYAEKHIFLPLQMKNSFIKDDANKISRMKASSYENGEAKWAYSKLELNYSTYGATNMNSTAEDLAEWLINFEKLKIGDENMLEKIEQRAVLNAGDTVSYASGLFVDKYKNLVRVFHDGTDAGYQTFTGYFPEKKLGIVVLSNLSSASPTSKAMRIADIYLQLSTARNAAQKPAVQYSFVKTNPSNFPAWSGIYETPGGNFIRIFNQDTALKVQFPDDDPATLNAVNDSVFHVFTDLLITFRNKTDSKFDQISFQTGTFSNTAKRVVFANYDQKSLQEFAGMYYSDELQTVYEVKVVNEQLVMSHVRNGDISLVPKTQDRFAAAKWYLSKVIFQRDKKRNVISFQASSGRTQNVLFKKLNKP